jgi:hypothetical protein
MRELDHGKLEHDCGKGGHARHGGAFWHRQGLRGSMGYGLNFNGLRGKQNKRERSERLWLRSATVSSKLGGAPVSMATARAKEALPQLGWLSKWVRDVEQVTVRLCA